MFGSLLRTVLQHCAAENVITLRYLIGNHFLEVLDTDVEIQSYSALRLNPLTTSDL
jgi:hypothetical protein